MSFLTSPKRWMTLGRFLIVDVDDHRQRQQRLVGVLGHQVDGAQALVVAVRLGVAGDPVQDEVGRRHQDDLAGVGVERILAGTERPFPDAAFALGDALAVAERVAGEIAADPAIVADHDADVADRHHRFGNHLDRGEPAVDEVGAVGQRHVLPAAPTAGTQEGFGILVVIVVVRIAAVVADGGSDDLAGRQRRAVVDGDDGDGVHVALCLDIERRGRFGNRRHRRCGRASGSATVPSSSSSSESASANRRAAASTHAHRRADHDGTEAVDPPQFLLPAEQSLQLACAALHAAGDRRRPR